LGLVSLITISGSLLFGPGMLVEWLLHNARDNQWFSVAVVSTPDRSTIGGLGVGRDAVAVVAVVLGGIDSATPASQTSFVPLL
jgi:hypothetical protein